MGGKYVCISSPSGSSQPSGVTSTSGQKITGQKSTAVEKPKQNQIIESIGSALTEATTKFKGFFTRRTVVPEESQAPLNQATQKTKDKIVKGLSDTTGSGVKFEFLLPALLKKLDDAKNLDEAKKAKNEIMNLGAEFLNSTKKEFLNATINEHSTAPPELEETNPTQTQKAMKSIIRELGLSERSDFTFQLRFLLKKLDDAPNYKAEERVKHEIIKMAKAELPKKMGENGKPEYEVTIRGKVNKLKGLDLLTYHLDNIRLNKKIDVALNLLNGGNLTVHGKAQIEEVLKEIKKPVPFESSVNTELNSSIEEALKKLNDMPKSNDPTANLAGPAITYIRQTIETLRP